MHDCMPLTFMYHQIAERKWEIFVEDSYGFLCQPKSVESSWYGLLSIACILFGSLLCIWPVFGSCVTSVRLKFVCQTSNSVCEAFYTKDLYMCARMWFIWYSWYHRSRHLGVLHYCWAYLICVNIEFMHISPKTWA